MPVLTLGIVGEASNWQDPTCETEGYAYGPIDGVPPRHDVHWGSL